MDENRLRPNAVSFPEALAQSVSVMAPAMSGAFITYLAAVKSGGATPLAFLLATGSCLLIGGVVSGFALRLPSAGSLYTYTVDGQRRGLLLAVAVGALATSAMALFGSLYCSFKEVAPGTGIPGPYRVVPALGATALLAAAGAAGVLRHRRQDVWHAMGAVFE